MMTESRIAHQQEGTVTLQWDDWMKEGYKEWNRTDKEEEQKSAMLRA